MTDKPGYCDHDGTQVGMPCPFCGRLNMNPTPTPPKTHEEVAKKLWKRLLDADVDACNPDCDDQTRGPVAILTTALRDAYENGQQQAYDHVEKARHLPGDKLRTVRVDHGIVDGLRQIEMKTAAPESHILDDAGNVRRDRLNEMREVRGWLSSALDRMELAEVTRLPWLAAALTNSYQQLDAFIGEREAALHAKDAHAGEKGAANGK